MNTKTLYKCSYIYLALPLLIFLFSWLDGVWGIIYSSLFLMAFYQSYKSIKNDDTWHIDTKYLFIIASLAVIWCFFAGIGYFYYQSFDYHFRNAVFRDLITYQWPVFYDKANTPLVYYMGFWLPSALLGKLFSVFISNNHIVFLLANVFLFLYASFGVSLIFIHLLKAIVKTSTLVSTLATCSGFIFFSGLDVLGYILFFSDNQPFKLHLEWWAQVLQYSSFSTDLFWVFNQFIAIALLFLIFFNERNTKNSGFLIALSLFFSPYPTFTIGCFMLIYAIMQFSQIKNRISFIKDNIFSLQNVIGTFAILPILILYFITNSQGIDRFHSIFKNVDLLLFISFIGFEFVLYAIFLFPYYKKHLFFITAIILLMFIPLLRLDQQNNFCMRASVPALITLFIYLFRFFLENIKAKKHILSLFWLSCFFLIGSATVFMEFYRGLHYTYQAKKVNLVADEIYTLNQLYVKMPIFGWSANHQFSALNYKNDLFWSFFAHRNIP